MKRGFLISFLLLFSNLFSFQSANKFLNFSDIHFDPFYDTTLVPQLARSNHTEWESILLNSESKNFSSYGSDCNYFLLRSALDEMSSRITDPDFIIITGDFMSHNFNDDFERYSHIKNTDSLNDFIAKTIKFITQQITNFFPTTTIFPMVGNDDAYCGNYMIDPGGPFLKMLGDVWEPMVNIKGNNLNFSEDFSKAGYCVVNFPGEENFKMIILNTIYFSTKYRNLCGDTLLDPGADELVWLSETLEQCRLNGKMVWLSYHIPPGVDIYSTITGTGSCEEKIFPSWDQKYNSEFLKIINEYSSIINSGFAGHFHRDDFRIFYNGNVPVSYLHITPSISPIYGNNPAYQIITYNKSDMQLSNYETYYLKNLNVTDSAYWTIEYDFQTAYNQSQISPVSLNNIRSLILTDSVYRSRYIRYYTGDNPKTFSKDYSNWFYNWCGLGHLSIEDYADCFCSELK